MTRIKVTGITRPEDAELAAGLGVDLVACVFYAQSPRYVTTAQAWEIRRALPPSVALHGVFVDTPPPLVQRIVHQCRLDAAVLFGAEHRSSVESIEPHAYKAVSVRSAGDVELALRSYAGRRRWRSSEEEAPVLQLHLPGALGAVRPLLEAQAGRTSLVLSSDDLDPELAADWASTLRPWALDAWTAVESEPGHLDPARLRALVHAIREADEPPAASG